MWAEIWDELQPQFDSVRGGGDSVYFEDAPFIMARLEGGGSETAWFNYSLSALRDEDDSVAAVLNITPETTGRLLLEQRLLEEQSALAMSEERLRLAVDSADVGFWDVDMSTNQLTWPSRTKAMFGISAHVPVTMDDFYNGIHPDDRDATVAPPTTPRSIRRCGRSMTSNTGPSARKDGVERWVAAKGPRHFRRDGTMPAGDGHGARHHRPQDRPDPA